MKFTTPLKYDDNENKLDQKVLNRLIKSTNIAAIIDSNDLTGIGLTCLRGYDIDKGSRSEWEKINEQAMKLSNQVVEAKSFPWPGAANVKYPLITTSAIQFHARAYPAIVQGTQVAKGLVNGYDPEGQKRDRAERIGKHMSYQLLNEMDDWEEETDKLLLNLAIVGCNFRKTFYDPLKGKNASIFILAEHLVVNHGVKSLEEAPRITQEFELYTNDIEERERSGIFIECEDYEENEDDAPIKFLEQHCWIDLDDDGYKEPYVVTMLKDSGKVVRIVARYTVDDVDLLDDRVLKINPINYYTKYSFIPNPDGGFYDIGLGSLMVPLSDTINTIINQILDAGTKQNAGGGFIGSGLRLKSGNLRFSPGEYKPVNQSGNAIRDNIYNIEHPGPSQVLFQMLGLLIDAGKDISSVKDILTGDANPNATATATLALIEQGQKVFTAIYKRIHRSLKKELKKLFLINKRYLPEESYFRVLDSAQPISIQDYQGDETDVTPISDPNMSTDAQQMARAEAYMKFAGDPYVNQIEIRKLYFKSLKEENPDHLLNKEPQPDPKQLQEQLQQMQEQGKQQQEQFGQYQEQAKAMAEKLKNENTMLKAQLSKKDLEDMAKTELEKIAEAQRKVDGDVSKAIDTLELEKQTLSVKMQGEIDSAINEVKNLVAQHELQMQKMMDSSQQEGEQVASEEKIAQAQQMHNDYMTSIADVMNRLGQMSEAMQKPRMRKLVMDESGEPVASVEVMQ